MSEYLKSSRSNWQESYKAALFDTDSSTAAQRIAEAERAIITRARDLFSQSNSAVAERNALDAALFALHILKIYSR